MNKQFIGSGYVSHSHAAYTVAQFCAAHCISRTHFYELIKQGLAPRLMKVGRRTLISAEASADWRKQMEAKTNHSVSFLETAENA